MKNRPIVLILDSDSPPGPSSLYSLAQARRYEIVGVTTRPAYKSSYSPKYRTAYIPDLDYGADEKLFVSEFADKFAGAVLLPTTNRSVEWLIRNQSELSKYWKLPQLPTLDSFRIASNKALLKEFCCTNQIPHPVTLTLSEFLQNAGKGIEYPVLAKPIQANGGLGIARFDDFESLQTWVEQGIDVEKYIVQNRLAGMELSCGFYCENGLIHTAVMYTGITRRSLYGPFLSLKFVRDDRALESVRQIVAALNWNGIANIDLRYQSETISPEAIPYILEVNPRLWGNVLGAAFKGVNFIDLMCRSALGEKLDAQNYQLGNYFGPRDSLGILWRKLTFRSLKDRMSNVFRWRDSVLKIMWTDPFTPIDLFFRSQGGSKWQKILMLIHLFKPPI